MPACTPPRLCAQEHDREGEEAAVHPNAPPLGGVVWDAACRPAPAAPEVRRGRRPRNCTCMRIPAHLSAHTHTHTYIHTHIRTYTHIHTNTHTDTNTHTPHTPQLYVVQHHVGPPAGAKPADAAHDAEVRVKLKELQWGCLYANFLCQSQNSASCVQGSAQASLSSRTFPTPLTEPPIHRLPNLKARFYSQNRAEFQSVWREYQAGLQPGLSYGQPEMPGSGALHMQ